MYRQELSHQTVQGNVISIRLTGPLPALKDWLLVERRKPLNGLYAFSWFYQRLAPGIQHRYKVCSKKFVHFCPKKFNFSGGSTGAFCLPGSMALAKSLSRWDKKDLMTGIVNLKSCVL